MAETFKERVAQILETIRTIEDGDGRAPTPEDIAEALGWSLEEILFILHRLVNHGLLTLIPSAYEDRYAVEDEDLLETLPDPKDEPSFGQAHEERKAKVQEQVGVIHQRFGKDYVDPDKQKLFDDVKTRLAGQGPVRANPLDGPAPKVEVAPTTEQTDRFAKLSEQLSGKTEKKINPLDALLQKKK